MLQTILFLFAALSPAQAASSGTTLLAPGSPDAPVVALDVPAAAKGQPKGSKDQPHPAVVRLVFDREAVAAGSTIRVGIHLDQEKNWHTYWHSPGDIGKPTEIDWTVPAGVEVSPFVYAVPARFELQGIVSYGYDGHALHISDMTVPATQPVGPMTVEAKVSWLVCEVSCIPGEATVRRTIDVVAAGSQTAASPQAALFDHTQKLHPTPMADLGEVSVVLKVPKQIVGPEQQQTVTIELAHPPGPFAAPTTEGTWPAFTPIIGDQWMVNDVRVKQEGQTLKIEMDVETFAPETAPQGDRIGGLIQFQSGDKWIRTEAVQPITWNLGGAAAQAAPPPVKDAKAPPAEPAPPPEDDRSLPFMLLLAFVGGMLLNIMPCVLPVLTLKVYSLVEQKDAEAAHRQMAGLAYAAGVILSFLVLGGVVIGMREFSGAQVGWGYQFQSPAYVAALGTIVFVFGLSLFGVFEVPTFGATQMSQASAKEGWVGHLMTGAFATLLATPCSAPFLGTGMGFAFTLPSWGILLFFGAAGLGLALPFLLIAYFPAMSRFLPRQGAWMESFKQFMGFTLIATTVWLVDVLAAQTGTTGAVGFLAFLTAVSLGCWIVGRWAGPLATSRSKAISLVVAVALSFLGGWKFLHLEFAETSTGGTVATAVEDLDFSESIPWQPFSEARVDELVGHTVFVDFTADWCLTCKVNEKTVLNTEQVRKAMADAGVVPLMADWTRQDQVITKWLQRYGRAGVPFYLVIPADRSKATIPLPEVITPGIVIDGIAQAR